jgi:hypothetical protein
MSAADAFPSSSSSTRRTSRRRRGPAKEKLRFRLAEPPPLWASAEARPPPRTLRRESDTKRRGLKPSPDAERKEDEQVDAGRLFSLPCDNSCRVHINPTGLLAP